MTQLTFMQTLRRKTGQLEKIINDNSTYLAGVLGVIALGIGIWYGYRYLTIQKEEAAQSVLADCFAEYENAAQKKGQWADVARMCKIGYEKYSSTKVAPYILAVEIDALLMEQKHDEALAKLDQMLARIGTSSPLYYLYKTKHALLKIDMPDVPLQQSGFKDLEQLAFDTKNIYNDEAQFYLGLYYRMQDQNQKAQEIWTTLAKRNENLTDKQAQSPWAVLAQEKINGLI